MKTISNFIESIEKTISIILMMAITIILFFNVISRYFLKDPIYWANESSIFMMAWITFLGGSLGLKYKTQASITFLVERLPGRKRRIMNIATHILILIFMALLLYLSYEWIFTLSDTKSSAMRIPMWIPYSCVPVGLTFASIHLLGQLIEYIKGDEQGEEESV